MNQQEQELVWLARKIQDDEDLIYRLEVYYEDFHHLWSREVDRGFVDMLFKMKDQFNYEEHRLEKLAWQVVEDRERRGQMPDREALVVFNQVTGQN